MPIIFEETNVPASAKKRTGSEESAPKRKWPGFTQRFGKSVREAGVTPVPRVLLTGVKELKLKPVEVLVLLQLLACWGKAGAHPFPKRGLLRSWIGCDKRTLDRAITSLVLKGFVEKCPRTSQSGRQTSNAYDLSGLIEKLKPLGRKAINERNRRAEIRAAAQSDSR